jgi:hypothetical protein
MTQTSSRKMDSDEPAQDHKLQHKKIPFYNSKIDLGSSAPAKWKSCDKEYKISKREREREREIRASLLCEV